MNEPTITQPDVMRRYYRRQAAIYDATRWSFLFGRNDLLRQLRVNDDIPQLLLEIGCGTGYNLRRLAENHLRLHLAAMDVSPAMLKKSAEVMAAYAGRVQLLEQAYGAAPLQLSQTPDFVLFSYALSMFNPGWEAAIGQSYGDLPAGGRIAVVDFHDTPSAAFRWWMQQNHVRMEGHLLPFLQARFRTEWMEIRPAWLGLWRYFIFMGQKV